MSTRKRLSIIPCNKEPTNEERSAIEKLRKTVRDVLDENNLNDDKYLLRFLRARNLDLIKADKMIRENLAWRAENAVEDDFLSTYKKPAILEKYYSITRLGLTKENSVLWIGRIGRIDIKGLFRCIDIIEGIKMIAYAVEESIQIMKEEAKKGNTSVDTFTIIGDMEGSTLSQAYSKDVLRFFLENAKVFEKCYPEMLKRIIMVNVSKAVTIGYSMIKPFLPPVTVNKIAMFTGSDDWKSALLDIIEPELLPQHWGGTRTDGSGQPDCPNLINRAGPVPTSLYRK